MTKHPPLFRRILVATDFSECSRHAFQQARWLAERMDAEIEIVHVLNDLRSELAALPKEVMKELVEGNIDTFEHALRAESNETLEAWIRPFRGQLPRIRHDTRLGVPYLQIARKVMEESHDLVIAGTHGKSGLRRVLIGSTAERLVRSCPCPVWVVKNPHAGCLNSILVPVEGSDVCKKTLRIGHQLAVESGAELEILHVFDVPKELRQLHQSATDDETAVERRRSVLWSAVDARLQQFVMRNLPEVIEIRPHIVQGETSSIILKRAKALSADLIVIGTVARGGLAGVLLGNTAEKILRTFKGSVLVIKPDGFVCPIEPSYRMVFPHATTGKV